MEASEMAEMCRDGETGLHLGDWGCDLAGMGAGLRNGWKGCAYLGKLEQRRRERNGIGDEMR
jgi:hypothetical protein